MDRRGHTGADTVTIAVGARGSNLSKAQVAEVYNELIEHYPQVVFSPVYVSSTGDIDRKTSLRTLDKTNFFTKEIDELQLKGDVRIAIHSAKDLPEPLAQGLQLIALTKGKDPRDALVFKKGCTLDTLPERARIGTSSIRRENMLKKIGPKYHFVDVRGTIEMRLQLIDDGIIDALVVAECALIRLGLEHLSRHILDDEAAPYQGRLAVIAQEGDSEMKNLFSCIHDENTPVFRA